MSNPHELTTYVIGMKIEGLSRRELLNAIYVTQADSGVDPHPEAEVGVPSNEFVLISGGFKVEWRGAGNLATASFPSTESSWKARSKDHIHPDPCKITAYALGIQIER